MYSKTLISLRESNAPIYPEVKDKLDFARLVSAAFHMSMCKLLDDHSTYAYNRIIADICRDAHYYGTLNQWSEVSDSEKHKIEDAWESNKKHYLIQYAMIHLLEKLYPDYRTHPAFRKNPYYRPETTSQSGFATAISNNCSIGSFVGAYIGAKYGSGD